MNKTMYKRLQALEGKSVKEKEKKGKKKKKYSIKKKAIYQIRITQFKIFLFELICMINGFDKDDYLYHDGFTMDVKFKFNKLFKELSLLGFEEEEKNDINSLKFRGRFATRILIYFFKNIDKVIDDITSDCGYYSWGDKISLFNKLMQRINKFVITYLSKDYNYKEHLDKLLEIMYIDDRRDVEATKVCKTYEVQSEFVKRACKTKEYDEDVMINNITKLAYVMATNKMNIKKCAEYEEGITTRDKEAMKNQIGQLGYAILKRRVKEPTTSAYKAFGKANPLFYSRFNSVNEEVELNIGTKALVFLKVLMDDPYVDKFIDKMIA